MTLSCKYKGSLAHLSSDFPVPGVEKESDCMRPLLQALKLSLSQRYRSLFFLQLAHQLKMAKAPPSAVRISYTSKQSYQTSYMKKIGLLLFCFVWGLGGCFWFWFCFVFDFLVFALMTWLFIFSVFLWAAAEIYNLLV